MAVISGAVGLVSVAGSSAFVFLHDLSNTSPLPTGAFLWDDTQPPRSAELVTRAMWLSLVNRSLVEHLSITIGLDDATAVATSVMLSDTVVDVGASALPRDAAKLEEMAERFAAADRLAATA